jgi:iron(III) transport system ATP-binding protein
MLTIPCVCANLQWINAAVKKNMPNITNGPYLTVQNLSRRFGTFEALRDISITIEEGEFVCFLGPSGCGKTTLLRCIAGLESQSTGSIFQKNSDISNLPPSGRDFGIVFQSYALFPNLSVFSNISYGLINKKWSKLAIKQRVNELLEMVGLTDHTLKYPSQLSGGEQQRVALARAIATSPGLLLLDEPLSALDAKVRVHLRKQIKDLHRKLGVTTIMVTHDQEEAQSMADRIFVMKDGEIIQVGTPKEIYTAANSPFIADFIGIMNFLPAIVVGKNKVRCNDIELECNTQSFQTHQKVKLAIRPECILLNRSNDLEADHSSNNRLEVDIDEVEYLGPFQRVYLKSSALSEKLIMVDVPYAETHNRDLTLDGNQYIELPAEDIQIYPDER